MERSLNILCLSCELKGQDLLRELKAEGNRVFLVTSENLRDEPWPYEAIDEIFFAKAEKHCVWDMEEVILGLAHLFRETAIDRIIAIDDFDVEKAALLREEFRIPGMGQTTARYFRDKLAMRQRAAEKGIHGPLFSPLTNNAAVNSFLDTAEGPWIIKPRGEAAAVGISKVETKDQAWEVINALEEKRHQFLIEQFKPGDVYHVDTISDNGQVAFSSVARYLNTPFEVAHGGGIFRSVLLPYDSEDHQKLEAANRELLAAFGMRNGASHSEFIKSREDGRFNLVETSARVAGAHLSDMIEKATGFNLWREWARLETARAKDVPYVLPPLRKDYAGIIVSLSKHEKPDTSSFDDPEIVWRIDKHHHVGFIVVSDKYERVEQLMDDYAERIRKDFHASMAPKKTFRE
jgi:hypothetical protein